MMTNHVLRGVNRTRVEFDPTDNEHLEAFKLLCIGNGESRAQFVIRQHPNLRFVLEEGFENVRTMMLHKVGKHYLKLTGASS